MEVLFELFWRFMVISLLAFGGGGPALALVERTAVADHAWIGPDEFAAAVSFGFITPGPILIMAAFIGYYAAGFIGAAIATIGVFVMPWALAAAAARQLRPYMRHPRLRGFGRGALPAVVGLFVVTVLSLARSGVTNVGYLAIAAAAAALSMWTKVHPFAILVGGAALGIAISLPGVVERLPAIVIP